MMRRGDRVAHARSSRRPLRAWGITRAVATGALVLGSLAVVAPAQALPPSGAGSDTPGTSSTVSPRTLQACQTISFTVTGFPAGETVYVKIDDGVGYGDTSIQGSGVVAQQRIPASGTVNGSFELPCGITPGAHWLRFLATAYVDPNDQGAGTIGYTNRGNSDFTVVAANGSNGSGSGGSGSGSGGSGSGSSGSGLGAAAPAAGTTNGSGSEQVGGAGGTLTIDPGAVTTDATPTPSATSTSSASPSPTGSTVTDGVADAADAQPAAASVPWIGIAGLAGLLAAGALVAWLVLRRRPAP